MTEHRAGRAAEAATGYREVLGRCPDHAGAWHLLGVARQQEGHPAEAVEFILRAIELAGPKGVYCNNLGVALRALGQLDEARDAFRQALAIAPGYADAESNLGTVLHDLGEYPEALAAFHRALALAPDHADALCNLAGLLVDQADRPAAIGLYRKVLALQPLRTEAHNRLGAALLAEGDAQAAAACFAEARRIAPQSSPTWIEQARALARHDRPEEAAECLREAMRLSPEKTIWKTLAASLCPTIFPDVEAIDRYRADLEATLDECLRAAIDCHGAELLRDAGIPSFGLAHHGRNNRVLKAKFAALYEPHFRRPEVPAGRGKPRIGFVVSARHEGGFLRGMSGLIERLDPARFDVVLLCSRSVLDRCRRAISRADMDWVPLPQHPHRAAEQVSAARCDVLYHWQIDTDTIDYFLPFAVSAPVQCTSWGTHGTSGIAAVDYYLSSVLLEPPGADDHYTEKLWQMSTLPTYQARQPAAPRASRRDFGMPERGAIYLSPHRIAKYHPDFDALLAGVLRADPQGTLVILEGEVARANQRLRQRLERTLGPLLERVVFLPTQERPRYHSLLALADVMLDSLHYCAGLMAYDAFSYGLPIITLPGEFNVGRYTAALYQKMGMKDLIASSAEGYVTQAVRLGTDRDYRDWTQCEIRARSETIFEDQEAVREHERFFEEALSLRQPDTESSRREGQEH